MEICYAEGDRFPLENKIWDLVHAPCDANIIGCKWTYKVKNGVGGKIQRLKACLIAEGFNQKYGCDYDEVFAPVARQLTFRILLLVAAARKMLNIWTLNMRF